MAKLTISIENEGWGDVILRCKVPPPQILKTIADLLNSYIDPHNEEFIDVEYFGVKVNETAN